MRLENATDISAPPEIVWAVTEDLERWPEWTPTVNSVARVDQGPLRVGSAALLQQPGMPEAEWVVTEVETGRRFSWRARVRGMHMVATHELTPSGEGTRNELSVELSGFVALLLWPLLRVAIGRALRQENAGLKQRCERMIRS